MLVVTSFLHVIVNSDSEDSLWFRRCIVLFSVSKQAVRWRQAVREFVADVTEKCELYLCQAVSSLRKAVHAVNMCAKFELGTEIDIEN